MKKILFTGMVLATVLFSCKKTSFDTTVTGEGLGDFALLTPSSGTTLVLNAAVPSTPVKISWTAAKPGVSIAPTYTWVAALKATPDFKTPFLAIASSGSGKATDLTLTYQAIDDALKAKGIAEGAKVELVWSVKADNGSTVVTAPSQYALTITRFQDGASPFVLLGPESSTTNVEINPSSTTDNFVFNWTKSSPAKTTAAVKYKVWFYNDDVTEAPVFSIASNNAGADSVLTMSWKAINDSLNAHGFTDPGAAAKLKWKVAATSGAWTQWSSYVNQIAIVRLVRMYLVGSITGWDINAPWEIIADKKADRNGKVFYTYVKLAPSDAFKFVKEKGNWGSAYGNAGGSAGNYTTGYNQGGDITVPTAGIYRVTIDLGASKIYVQQKQPGIVGDMQGWNPATPTLGGMYGSAGKFKFLIVTTSATTDQFKIHDGPEWDNSNPNNARWWGKGTADGLLDLDGNGGNFMAPAAPRSRVIWDGSDPQQLKYELSAATEMRVVGDGINQTGVNEWDPPTSPQMTYAGNGKWTISITLKAAKSIKFVAGNAWGAFDYEDNGDAGSVAGTTKRSIKWEGGDNFTTPAAAGTYTITLDEHAGTVTIQ